MKRRQFLQVSVTAGGAFLLGFRFDRAFATPAKIPIPNFEPNGFIRISPDNSIVIMAKNPDIGQGVKTALPLIVAEELEADWSKVQVQMADLNIEKHGEQTGGGSQAIQENYDSLRRAGAAAREMLILAAAETWKVNKNECFAEKNTVIHRPSGRRLTYGELAEAAARQPVPENPLLKDPKDFKLLGTYIHDVDSASIVSGQPLYGIDVRVPGMLYAVIARPPRFGAKVLRFDDSQARTVGGVRQIIQLETTGNDFLQRGGIAVLAESTWAAIKGRNALDITWDEGSLPPEDSATLRRKFLEILDANDLPVIREDGNVKTALSHAVTVLEATYEVPLLAHVTMEPMNYTAWVQAGKVEAWGPTQVPDAVKYYAQQITGVPESDITVHITRSGGGFGRRLAFDYAVDALQLSQKTNAPVQVLWTREDDLANDFYRPAGMFRIRAGVDAAGRLIAWHAKGTTTSRYAYRKSTRSPHTTEVFPDELPAGMVPNYRLEYKNPPTGIPVGAWRAPGHNSTAFAIQSFIDELAHAAGKDPLAFRLDLIGEARVMPYRDHGGDYDTGRLRGVLQLAAEKAGWGKPLPTGHYHGLAAHVTFGVPVAEIVEISMPGGQLKVHKVTVAVWCGQIINRTGAEQQVAGAILDGLSAALYGKVSIENGAAMEQNFHLYRMLRMPEAPPEIEVHFMESHEAPRGLGEMGLPPVAAAVCNAIFAATGKRIRELPVVK